MSDVTENTFNHKFYISLLPSEPLVGIKIHNTEALCIDEQFRPLFGIELGFLFFTLSYTHIKWK